MSVFRIVAFLVLLLASGQANAQGYIRVTNCGDPRPPVGSSQGYQDLAGNICVLPGGAYNGNGTLSVTTSSAAINTMTLATGSTLPTTWSNLTVWNPSAAGNIAVCPRGGSCTCPENTVAATNGNTILKSGGSWTYALPTIAAATPTIVACSSTAVVEFAW